MIRTSDTAALASKPVPHLRPNGSPNWKSFLLSAAWRALKKALLYGSACGLLFLLMVYALNQPLQAAEKLRGLFSLLPPVVLFSSYALAGFVAGWCLGVTSGVASEAEETARMLFAFLQPAMQRLVIGSPARRLKLPIPATREALERELNVVLLAALPGRILLGFIRPVARFLEAKALGSFRKVCLTALEDLERNGDRVVTLEAVLDIAKARFPEIIGEEVKGHWRIGARVIAALTALLLLAPAVLLLAVS